MDLDYFDFPLPSKDAVVGILGPNGMGKSTAINALSGQLIPNLSDWKMKISKWDEVIQSLPRGELRDFLGDVQQGQIRVAGMTNMSIISKVVKGKVGALLSSVDERACLETVESLVLVIYWSEN